VAVVESSGAQPALRLPDQFLQRQGRRARSVSR
jgi:hypothetical protein